MDDVLVVGSGGREHALAWRLSQGRRVGRVFVAPGNGGTQENVGIAADDLGALADFAEERGCFTVVGPEAPLAAGICDLFERRGLGIFGPSRAAARLESSKAWAKGFMRRHGIRTARSGTFGSEREALEYLGSLDHDVVVKADGLAAGKGVVVCGSRAEAEAAVRSMLVDGRFGEAGGRIVIEERLEGQEASCIALCDGTAAVPMASSRDHKRALDGDRGPNTGGMGAYSPAPGIEGALAREIQEGIIEATVRGMAGEGSPFRGFLYAGVMVCGGTPYVLEYNVRMGDPECQPIMMRADFDLYEYLLAASRGGLSGLPAPSWRPGHAACIVLASKGYPGGHPSGEEISGLAGLPHGAVAFHAGTQRRGGAVVSAGGRVLGVTALGGTLGEAVSNAYDAAGRISWGHKFCRTDIGRH